jgi:hypothetical protein
MLNTQPIKRFFLLLRDTWLIIGMTIVLLFLGHYILGAAAHLKDLFEEESHTEDTSGRELADPRARSPVYENFPDEYFKENAKTCVPKGSCWLSTHFEPYYHWRRNGFVGKFINVSPEGVRLTVKEDIRAGAKKIFMYGGSTLWGSGSPDGETIPSILQSLLGDDYDVYNFGETGYVSTQELNYLLYQLSMGDIPDVVIFYDGVNDAYAGAYSPAIPRDPHGLRVREKEIRERKEQAWFIRKATELYELSNYRRLVGYLRSMFFADTNPQRKWDKQVEKNIKSNSILVLDMYEAHIKQVKALSKEYGFEVLFFWQPGLFSLTRKTDSYEESIIERASPVWVESNQEVYRVAKDRLVNREHEGVYFLGNIFDEVDESIYVDWCHIGPNGNKIVAKEMFNHIQATLKPE